MSPDPPGPAIVLDASALLAYLHHETGWEMVRRALPEAAMSSVNWAEVLQRATERGSEIQGMREELEALGVVVVPFDIPDAEASARLHRSTRAAGLSLGDRACLALAQRLGIPALTADRAWKKARVDVEVRLVRA